jgi:hypothetical protein
MMNNHLFMQCQTFGASWKADRRQKRENEGPDRKISGSGHEEHCWLYNPLTSFVNDMNIIGKLMIRLYLDVMSRRFEKEAFLSIGAFLPLPIVD